MLVVKTGTDSDTALTVEDEEVLDATGRATDSLLMVDETALMVEAEVVVEAVPPRPETMIPMVRALKRRWW